MRGRFFTGDRSDKVQTHHVEYKQAKGPEADFEYYELRRILYADN